MFVLSQQKHIYSICQEVTAIYIFSEKCTNLVVEGKTKQIVILNLTDSERYSVEALLSFFVKFGNRQSEKEDGCRPDVNNEGNWQKVYFPVGGSFLMNPYKENKPARVQYRCEAEAERQT